MPTRREQRAGGFVLACCLLALAAGCAWPFGKRAGPDRDALRARREAARAAADATALAGGEAPRPRPDWAATGVAARFPETRYLRGVGAARLEGAPEDAAALADERARAELARQVRARIRSALHSEAAFATSLGETTADSAEVAERILSESDVQLAGVRIAERWQDPNTGAWWSLAVLDRAAHVRSLRQRAVRLRAEVAMARAELLAEGPPADKWERFRRASRALAKAREWESVRAQLVAFGEAEAGPGALDARAFAELRAEQEAAQRAFSVGLAVFVEPAAASVEAEARFAKALSDLGFSVVLVRHEGVGFEAMKSGAAAELRGRLAGQADALAAFRLGAARAGEERLAGLPVYFYEARGQAFFRDLASGEVVAASAIERPAATRKGAPRADRASAAALAAGAEELARAFGERLGEAVGLRH